MVECTPEARVNIALPCTQFYLSNWTACNGKTLYILIYFFSFHYIILYIRHGNCLMFLYRLVIFLFFLMKCWTFRAFFFLRLLDDELITLIKNSQRFERPEG